MLARTRSTSLQGIARGIATCLYVRPRGIARLRSAARIPAGAVPQQDPQRAGSRLPCAGLQARGAVHQEAVNEGRRERRQSAIPPTARTARRPACGARSRRACRAAGPVRRADDRETPARDPAAARADDAPCPRSPGSQAQQLLDRRSRPRAERPPVGGRVRPASTRALPLLDERLDLRRQLLKRADVPGHHEPIKENRRLQLEQRRGA